MTKQKHIRPPVILTENTDPRPDPDRVAALAYEIWTQRGRPDGTAEEDWLRAEAELRNSRTRTAGG